MSGGTGLDTQTLAARDDATTSKHQHAAELTT